MKQNIVHLGEIFLLACFLAGCAIGNPEKNSGLARFKLTDISSVSGCIGCRASYQDRAIIVSLVDKDGNEIFNERDRSGFTYTLDVPEGDYTVVTTCSPAAYRYEKDKKNYDFKFTKYKVSAHSGDYISLRPVKNMRGCVAKLGVPRK